MSQDKLRDQHSATLLPMVAALKTADAFIAGFEDDQLQEGISAKLNQIRSAIEIGEGRGGDNPALDLLHRSLEAWENEEDSVQDEHADLIRDLRKFLYD